MPTISTIVLYFACIIPCNYASVYNVVEQMRVDAFTQIHLCWVSIEPMQLGSVAQTFTRSSAKTNVQEPSADKYFIRGCSIDRSRCQKAVFESWVDVRMDPKDSISQMFRCLEDEVRP